MKKKKNIFFKLTIIFGVLFLANYLFSDYLWEKFWILSLFSLALIGLTFLVFWIIIISEKNKKGILFGIFIVGIVLVSEILNSELCKSKKILEATLMDDLSAIHLTLRADNTFEVVSSTLFDNQIFKGDFVLIENKIVFKDRPYNNDFIPDTIVIIGEKIICQFDQNGDPVTDFASYFGINRNEINKTKSAKKKQSL